MANLIRNYNTTVNAYVNQCNASIKTILQSRLTNSVKTYRVNIIKSNFQTQLNILRNKLNAALADIPIISNKNALLVGCNYLGTPNQLSGCVNDVNDIKRQIVTYGFNIVTITDADATRANIITAFTNLLVNSKPGDVLFFAFSGHGAFSVDPNSVQTEGGDEYIVTVDMRSIADFEFNAIIQTNLKKGVTLFAMFDSCHSGTMLNLRYRYLETVSHNQDAENIHNTETAGSVVMISGCADTQTSADAYINAMVQGAMSWALLASLKTNTTWSGLLTNMRTLLQESQYTQIPQLSSGNKININSRISFI